MLAAIAAQRIASKFPQTWWFRNDCIHIRRGPLNRRIQWEAIRRWQLTPAPDSPGAYLLTVWHGYLDEEQASRIMVSSEAIADQIEQLLGGYERAV
jgi:hypothetical protein